MLVFDKAFLGGVLYDEPSQLIPGYQVAVIRNIGCEMLALQDQNKTALWLCLCSVTLTESMLIFYLPTYLHVGWKGMVKIDVTCFVAVCFHVVMLMLFLSFHVLYNYII